MNQLLKNIAIALLNGMMIFTFVLMPYPSSIFQSNTAHAQETDQEARDAKACEDEASSDQQSYKVGCEFNDDLATTDLKNVYSEGTKGIVEQFIGAAFAMIGVMLFWSPIPQEMTACPGNQGGAITFPIVQAGSLSYLLGEIAANGDFKKASKIAVDKSFQAKQSEKRPNRRDFDTGNKEADDKAYSIAKKQYYKNIGANNKQLEAFDALEKIYEKQISGLKKKVIGTTIAEATFVTATAIEISNMFAMKAECSGTHSSMLTAFETGVTSLTTAITAVTAQQATYSATCGTPGGQAACPLAAGCGYGLGFIAEYEALLAKDIAATEASSKAHLASKLATSEGRVGELAAFMATLPTAAVAGTAVPTAGKVIAENTTDETTRATTETADKTAKGARLAVIASATPGLTACTPAGATAIAAMEAIEAARAGPVFCCGTQSEIVPTLDGTGLLALNYQEHNMDLLSTGATAVTHNLSRDQKYYVMATVENLLHAINIENIKGLDNLSAAEKLAHMKANAEYIDYIMANQDSLLDKENIEKEVKKALKIYDGLRIEEFLATITNKFKSEIFISSAHAMDFKELLNIGVKAVILYFVLGSWMKENAFPRPKTRAWTWGIMSVMNGFILSFNKKSLSETESRLERVKLERDKWVASSTKTNSLDSGSDSTSNRKVINPNNLVGDGNGNAIIECAVPKGNGFAPATCPSPVNRSRFTLRSKKSSPIRTNSLIGSTAGLIMDSAGTAAAKGVSTETLSSGTLGNIEKNSNAIKKLNKKLIAKLDKEEERSAKKLKRKPSLLGPRLATTARLFSDDPNKSGVTESQLSSGSKGLLPKLEKLKVQQKVVVKKGLKTLPKFNIPKSDTFDFDMGDDTAVGGTTIDESGETAAGEENLADFQLNTEDEINENEDVNIFKLISNRYLQSYPVLLEEQK